MGSVGAAHRSLHSTMTGTIRGAAADRPPPRDLRGRPAAGRPGPGSTRRAAAGRGIVVHGGRQLSAGPLGREATCIQSQNPASRIAASTAAEWCPAAPAPSSGLPSSPVPMRVRGLPGPRRARFGHGLGGRVWSGGPCSSLGGARRSASSRRPAASAVPARASTSLALARQHSEPICDARPAAEVRSWSPL